MSVQEADSHNTGEQASASPIKKSKSTIPKPDNDAIDKRRNKAIGLIPDSINKKTQLYRNAVAIINKLSLRRNWTETSLYKSFIGWSEFAELTERPKLDYMIATRAVHDAFEVRNSKFLLEISKRGLEDWVNEQLEVQAQKATTSKPTSQVKTEPGSQNLSMNTIQQSIEGPVTGEKRSAPTQSSEPMNKRQNLDTSQALGTPKSTVPMLQLPQQRIVFREAGTQTDQSLALEEVREAMENATARMERQTQVLEGHNAMFNELAGRTTISSTRPSVNHAHQALQFQGEPQEIFPVQYINRQQGPSSFYGRGQDPGPSSGFFRFG